MKMLLLFQMALAAVFVSNVVLHRFLGLCPVLGVSRKLSSAIGMGVAVTFVMTVAVAATWPLDRYILEPGGYQYLRTIVFILVIASLVQLVELVLQRYAPSLYESLGIYLPLIATNCAVFGIALVCTGNNHLTGARFTFAEALAHAFFSGIGFTLALLLMAGVRERLRYAQTPRALAGLPIAFLSAGLIALAFFGFSGLVVQ